jgi:hypothetical protein
MGAYLVRGEFSQSELIEAIYSFLGEMARTKGKELVQNFCPGRPDIGWSATSENEPSGSGGDRMQRTKA